MAGFLYKGILLQQQKEPALSRDLREFFNADTIGTQMAREPVENPDELTPDELCAIAREARIIDECDGLLLADKLDEARARKAVLLVGDAIDDEPYISSQLNPLLKNQKLAASGLRFLQRAVGASDAYFAIYKNLTDLETKIPRQIDEYTVKRIRGRYPAEYQASKTHSGGGRLMVGAGAVLHFARAVLYNKPQTTAFVTVAGNCIGNPTNLEISLGMTVAQALERCGLIENPSRVIIGGSMTGICLIDTEHTLVTPSTRAILAFREDVKETRFSCIGCSRCVHVCPEGLNPFFLYRSVKRRRYGDFRSLDAQMCIGCGTCSYMCPAKLDLSATIREGQETFRHMAGSMRTSAVAQAKTEKARFDAALAFWNAEELVRQTLRAKRKAAKEAALAVRQHQRDDRRVTQENEAAVNAAENENERIQRQATQDFEMTIQTAEQNAAQTVDTARKSREQTLAALDNGYESERTQLEKQFAEELRALEQQAEREIRQLEQTQEQHRQALEKESSQTLQDLQKQAESERKQLDRQAADEQKRLEQELSADQKRINRDSVREVANWEREVRHAEKEIDRARKDADKAGEATAEQQRKAASAEITRLQRQAATALDAKKSEIDSKIDTLRKQMNAKRSESADRFDSQITMRRKEFDTRRETLRTTSAETLATRKSAFEEAIAQQQKRSAETLLNKKQTYTAQRKTDDERGTTTLETAQHESAALLEKTRIEAAATLSETQTRAAEVLAARRVVLAEELKARLAENAARDAEAKAHAEAAAQTAQDALDALERLRAGELPTSVAETNDPPGHFAERLAEKLDEAFEDALTASVEETIERFDEEEAFERDSRKPDMQEMTEELLSWQEETTGSTAAKSNDKASGGWRKNDDRGGQNR